MSVFTVLLGGLAFLLASTPAHNSDLWLHLASGRLLSAGRLPDGIDPFSSATGGVYWVNQTWLSDLLFYQLYQIPELGNGTALVIDKASLTALLAALLLCFRRRGEGKGILPLSALLAILALGPWLLLQPILLSLLGLLLTVYLLERPSLLEGASAERARKARWLLVPLFALWANLDAWFILGPILVGLYAVGELLRRPSASGGGGDPPVLPPNGGNTPPARRLVLLFCAGLAACLATPYHYRVFAWPTPLGLTHTEQALRHDPLGQQLVFSPFGGGFAASALFRSPGAWAYYLLLAASSASFVLSLRILHLGRLLAWLALAALSIYQARAIPFFVVAAAPFLALNVQEWTRSRPYSESLQRLRIVAWELAVLIGLVLPVLAWPGWLQPAPYQPRGWTVEPDGSLVRLAGQLKRWHAEGRLRSDRFAFTFSPEVAHYLAWFCPEEKGFVDSRWPLFDGVADDYARMRRCLLQEDRSGVGEELASLLEAHRIDRIIVHASDRDRMARADGHLFLAPEWEFLAAEGGATLFRHRNGSAPSAEAFDYRRAAYHPTPDRCVPPAPRPPRLPKWYDAFRRHPDSNSADGEEAALHLLAFDVQAQQQLLQWLSAQALAVMGCAAGGEPTATAVALATRLHFTLPPPAAPEPLLLAVRAARRALASNPDDAGAFLLLGEGYFRLARQTAEASWQVMFPTLAELRLAQTLTALEQAVLLQPDLDRAHALLDQLYLEQGQMDRCLDHRRARLRIAEHAVKHGGPEAASAAERITVLRAGVENLEKVVNESEKTYQANLAGKTDPSKVLLRAKSAAEKGLSRKALEMLLESSPAIFGKEGVLYELGLMMKAGQCYQVRDWLEPGHERQIGFDKYHEFKALAAAGCGDYAEADKELNRGSEPLRWIVRPPKLLLPARSAAALHVAEAVLTCPPIVEGTAGRASAIAVQYYTLVRPMETPARLLRQHADKQVLRGLLALESGAVEKARRHFRDALDVWVSEAEAESGGGLDFPARPIAEEMLHRLQE